MARNKIDNQALEGDSNSSRRDFLKKSSLLTAFALAPPTLVMASEKKWDEKIAEYIETVPLSIEVNGTKHTLNVEPRTTLLDLLRENLQLTGTKKGCDHGQCGACTVHVNGTRILSCYLWLPCSKIHKSLQSKVYPKEKNCIRCRKLS